MKLSLAFALSALLYGSFPASAKDFVVTVTKEFPGMNIKSISIKDGEVTGLPEGLEPAAFDITVKLPDGVCYTNVRIRFTDYGIGEMWMDFCRGGGIQIGR
jgi:hypothetical protein